MSVCLSVCSLSTEAQSELMRMDRVYTETSQRLGQLQQQLSQLPGSDDDTEKE